MLEEYKNTQTKFYNFAKKIVENDKVSHAYFIETSSFVNGEKLAVSFAKFLLCKDHNINKGKCIDCNICNLIDSDIYQNLYIINPDGLWIKKEQILKLKEEFSNKSIDNNLRIYIINKADKLNLSAANSLLKFLEEPEENIIGILVSENRYNVTKTILSRCQIFKLNNEVTIDINDYDEMFDFAMNLERNGIQTICYINDLWIKKYDDKEQIIRNFNILEEVYMDIINYKLGKGSNMKKYIDDIKFICINNTFNNLLRKINVINDVKSNIKFNLNTSLMMDKFIIDFVGGSKYD